MASESTVGSSSAVAGTVVEAFAGPLDAGSDLTTETLVDLARSSQLRPSFWGHPYTCDGTHVPGRAALCAPQQIIFGINQNGAALAVTGWIATDELFASIDP